MKDKQLEIISRQLGVMTTLLLFIAKQVPLDEESMKNLNDKSNIIRNLVKEVENENN